MADVAPVTGSTRVSCVLSIASFVVAAILILAAAPWPHGYYQFLRIVTFLLSAAVIFRAFHVDRKGWLIFGVIGAIVYNPFLPLRMDKGDWSLLDIAFAIGFGAFGIATMNKPIGKMAAVLLGIVSVGTFAGGYYVNHHLPHGPSYPTGDIVCQNDGRGPCGEAYEEDLRELNIPEWAKFLRENGLLIVFLSAFAAIVAGAKARETEPDLELWGNTEGTHVDWQRGGDGMAHTLKQFGNIDIATHLTSPALPEPVERAARALAQCAHQTDPEAWRSYVAQVRTVVEALDEPTSGMIDAGNAAMRGAWIARGQLAPEIAGDAAVSAAWEAMIDRLLGHS